MFAKLECDLTSLVDTLRSECGLSGVSRYHLKKIYSRVFSIFSRIIEVRAVASSSHHFEPVSERISSWMATPTASPSLGGTALPIRR